MRGESANWRMRAVGDLMDVFLSEVRTVETRQVNVFPCLRIALLTQIRVSHTVFQKTFRYYLRSQHLQNGLKSHEGW